MFGGKKFKKPIVISGPVPGTFVKNGISGTSPGVLIDANNTQVDLATEDGSFLFAGTKN